MGRQRRGFRRLSAGLVLLAALACGHSPASAEVRTLAYQSPAVARTLKCRVILPAGYEGSGRRYPVLYLLHGFSGDSTSWSRHGVEASAAPYDWIVVLADGGNSWFVNWSESGPGASDRWEDALVKDLIPAIDTRFRTVARREGRAVLGLSMGGYGAMAVGLRNPAMFASVGSTSGALDFARSCGRQLRDDPGARLPSRSPSAKVNAAIGLDDFDSQEERTPRGRVFTTPAGCDDHDPFTLVTRLPREALPHLYVDCGTEDPFLKLNQEFARLLIERGVTFTYAQSPGEHRSAYWTREVRQAMAVQYEVVRRAMAGVGENAARPAR